MPTTATTVAIYYLGFGFVIFLGWACIALEPLASPGADRRRRLHRLAVALSVAGVLHPALALAGRDIAAQLGRADGPHDPRARRTLLVTSSALAIALVLFAAVVTSAVVGGRSPS